jgi:hypothetical protein
MSVVTTLCGGFLLAVLWFDLMFDVQVLGAASGPLPEDVLASIAGYYARVTTGANPMGRMVGIMMLILIVANVRQIVRRSIPRTFAVSALVFALPPIVLAMARIVPNAIRLGHRSDSIEVQSSLARSICHEHIACIVAIGIFCAIQLNAQRVVARLSDRAA